jgi:hypothetical protein
LYHSNKGFQPILILRIQQAPVKGITSVNKETIMKTEETHEKKITIVYRKDGKTPDLRYKSSRDYVSSQHIEKNAKKKEDIKAPDLRYKSLRNHVTSQPLEKNTNPPVQIKPSGKKPVWKISN